MTEYSEKGTGQAVLLHTQTPKPWSYQHFVIFRDDCKVYVQSVREKYILCCKKLESNLFWCNYFNHLFSK